MANAIGVTMSLPGTTAGAKTAGSNVASKATAGAGASTVWPWVSLGVVGLVVGAVVGVRAWNASRPQPAPTAPAPLAPPTPPDSPRGAVPAGQVAEPIPGAAAAVHRGRVATATANLRDEISFVDAAPNGGVVTGIVVTRSKSWAATVTNTRPGAFVPKQPQSGLRR